MSIVRFLLIFLILMFFTVSASASIITPPLAQDSNLVLRLGFDEGNGTTAYDSSGNGNNGTIYGANWTTGRYGYGLSFDGVDDYVEVPDSASLKFTNFTITFWINGQANDVLSRIVSKRTDYTNNGFEVTTNKRYTDLFFRLFTPSGWSDGPTALGVLQENKWQFFAVRVYADTVTHAEILDGNGNVLAGYSWDSVFQFNTTEKLYVGRDRGGNNPFNGIIDEVRIYNRALSEEEIKSIYEALRIHIRDETNQQAISSANVTVFNSNTSISVPIDDITNDAVLFHANMSSYGYGQYFVSVSANNYYERKLIANTDENSLTELTSYLPPSSANVVYDVFTLEDPTSSFISTETILQIKKPISGEVVPVFQSYFDFNNQAGTYLILDDYYQLSLISGNQESNFGWLIPDPDGQITIIPSKITINSGWDEWVAIEHEFDDLTKTITVEYNATTPISKAILWINFSNGTNAYYAEIDNQSTGSFTYTALTNDSYLVRLRVETVDGRVYDPFWFVDWSEVKERIAFLTDLPSWAKEVVVVGMLIIFLLIFGNYRADVSTAMTTAMASLAWWLGWLDTNITVIVIMAIIAGGAVINYQRKEVRD